MQAHIRSCVRDALQTDAVNPKLEEALKLLEKMIQQQREREGPCTPAEHPNHSGDMPPLLGNQGYAWMAFYDKRFTIPEIIGKSLIIHRMPDNFTTQPAGDSGERIACGVIK